MSALGRWLERRELPVIDEATARERCSPLTDAEGNRERLIAVAPRAAPLGHAQRYAGYSESLKAQLREPLRPTGYGVHMNELGQLRKDEPDAC